MKSILINSFLLFLLFQKAFSQNSDIVWSKIYGGSEDDWANSIEQTIDAGYIICGVTYSNDGDATGNHGQSDIWISKLDFNGNIEWEKTYGGSNYENCGSIRQTSDHGYIFCGSTDSNNGDVIGNHDGGDAWIVKIDSAGIIQWQKYFGGSGSDGAFDIKLCSDGGYVFSGSTTSTDGDIDINHGGIDTWVVKLDSVGNKIWSRTYGGSLSEGGNSITTTFDGGYVVASTTDSQDGDLSNANYHGISDYWILKLDSLGDTQWSKCFGGSNAELVYSIQETNEGGFIVGGVSRSDDGDITAHHGTTAKYDFWIDKINESGNLTWQKSLGGTNDDECFSVMQTEDGQFLAAGYATSNDGDITFNHSDNSDSWIVKLDSFGNLLWQNSYGGSNSDGATSILQSSDGSYTFFGGSSSNDYDVSSNNGGLDYWIVKLSPSTLVNSIPANNPLSIFPNPANDVVMIDLNKNMVNAVSITIINSQGKILRTEQKTVTDGKLNLDVSSLCDGIYFLKIKEETATYNFKLAVAK